MKTVDQAATEWANDHCGIDDTVEATNKDINLYLRSAFAAGAEWMLEQIKNQLKQYYNENN